MMLTSDYLLDAKEGILLACVCARVTLPCFLYM